MHDRLGLDSAIFVEAWPVHGEALVRHVVPVLGASNVLQRRRLAPAIAFHFGRMGDDLDVAVHVGGELVNPPAADLDRGDLASVHSRLYFGSRPTGTATSVLINDYRTSAGSGRDST
jgi:hypothetical protein